MGTNLKLRCMFPHIRSKAFHFTALVGATVCIFFVAGFAAAQERTITPTVSIEQDQLEAGAYSVSHVLQSGRQFFAVPFLPADGHGEGDTGPRAMQREQMWQNSSIPFLRVNGLDSASCFACHNSAGTYVPKDQLARTQKPGGVGGSGDFTAALLQSEDFPKKLNHILRVPPRVYGSAYLQELGLEMTENLLSIQKKTIQKAMQRPGNPVTVRLNAKGVDFGRITITCRNAKCAAPLRDTKLVMGVSADLIVRPFQHKGVAATLRSFVKTALNFHHSMQAVEVVGIN